MYQQQQMMAMQQQQMTQQQIPQRYYPQGQPVPQGYAPPRLQPNVGQPQQAMAAQSAIFQERPPVREQRGAQLAFQNLPPPSTSNLAYIPASDRATYDAALDQQYKQEQVRLQQMLAGGASPGDVQAQRDRVYQMEQQVQMAVEQTEARAKKKAAKAQQQPAKELSLPEALTEFFRVHEPEVLDDGRLEAVLEWAEERGVEKLCAMLREQYGADLFGKRNLEDNAVDQVQADRVARKLLGFYKAHNVTDRTGWTDVIKVAEWAVKRGEAALNQKLNAKYGDDLDQYAQRVKLDVEPKLRAFLEEKDPITLEEAGTTGMVGFAVANGIDALNAQLLQRYGADLKGSRAPSVEEKRGKSVPDARAILFREMSQSDAFKHAAAVNNDDDDEDLLKSRKEQLIRQLASFLEAKDPKRLQEGGLVPLVQWAIVRSDKQVDELLMEAYGDDLRQAGLRRLSFDDAEVSKWAGGKVPDGPAGRFARAASVATEEDIVRAEVRSMRMSTHEAVVNAPVARRGSSVARDSSGDGVPPNHVVSNHYMEVEVAEPNF